MLIMWRPRGDYEGCSEGITSADVLVWGEGGTFAQQIAAGRHQLRGDEPDSVGGSDAGLSPYDFLLAALGSCTSMTVRMSARKKNWPLEWVTTHDEFIHATGLARE